MSKKGDIAMKYKQGQRGAVSLFIVIFTALLITVITVSFIRLMIRDQQQATDNDLSQSALDSAQAGVEDAKRALLRYQKACSGSDPVECAKLKDVFDAQDCNTVAAAGVSGDVSDPETMIQQSTSSDDSALDQAYTCVTVTTDTSDYLGQLEVDGSKVIPLKGVTNFDRVVVSWFSSSDFTSATASRTISLQTDADAPLPPVSAWPSNRPPVLNAQLIQTSSTFRVSDFDDNAGANSNANTQLLYPARAGLNSFDFISARRTSATSISPVRCRTDINSGGYACTTELRLPNPIGGDASNRLAFLRLSARYNATHYTVMLQNGSDIVKFSGVQPSVDSTGRANDLFRRIESRIELGDTFPYPEGTIDINGNLCKAFYVTDNTAQYAANAACDPSTP